MSVKNRSSGGQKKKSSRKKGSIILLAVLLGIVGLGLIFSPSLEQILIRHRSAVEMTISKDRMKQNKREQVSYDPSTVQSASMMSLVENQLKGVSLPVIGLVSIPELRLNLPIIKGDGYYTMLYGAGTMKENQTMGEGNYAIASHHVSNVLGSDYDGILFSPLQNAQSGQKVYLTDKTKVYVYQVNEITKVLPNQGNVILDVPGKKMVTLVTCYSDNTYRLIVQGKLIKTLPYDNQTASYFSQQLTQYDR
ncbi:class A sortase [Lactococcus lactis]|uniref:class A sortase n=1 Tax=Lactococcus lactis TaxID=1358 RepID=UPI0018C48BAA|nr:class A sortase [Lactococcus lactis]